MLGLRVIPEDVAKTSLPQTWHQPRGETIQPKEVQNLVVQGYNAKSDEDDDSVPRPRKSTLYFPIRGEFPSTKTLLESLKREEPVCQFLHFKTHHMNPFLLDMERFPRAISH